MVSADWRLTYWNAAAEDMFGVGREVALGRELWAVLPVFRREGISERLVEVQRSRGRIEFVADLPVRTGGAVSVTASPLEDGGLCLQLRRASEETREKEQYLTLLEASRSGCVAIDEEWRIVYINSAAEYLLGVDRASMEGRFLLPLLPPNWSEVEACLRATMADGVSRHLQDVRPENRRRAFHLWAQRLDGGGIAILFEDVTKQFRREKRLARLAIESQEANRAKSRFFAAVSHELRTPLNAIIGYTHLLSAETYGALPKAARRAADRVGMCADHLAKLVDDLLLLTGAELNRLAPDFDRVRLSSIIRSATDVYRHRAEAKGVDFRLSVPEETPEIVTDPERLRQVLGALLSNAVKHTSRGHVALAVRADGEEMVFTVEDTGRGIEPADQKRIFAPFEQAADAARSNPMMQGSGLGLAVASELASLLGGSLRLVGSSPAGSTFELSLPLLPRPAHSADKKPGPTPLHIQMPGSDD